jgi:glucose-6-phosphate 1-dehydrogenase
VGTGIRVGVTYLMGMKQTRPRAKPPEPCAPEPCAIVIFGAGGDLTERLLLPSLYNLQRQGLLPADFAVIGVAVSDRTTASWIQETTDFFKEMIASPDSEFQAKRIDPKAWGRLKKAMSYFRGDISAPETFVTLREHIEVFDKKYKLSGNVLFYLALPESFFGPTVDNLAKAGMLKQSKKFWRRVVIEKPFGHDEASAKALNADILKSLDETQIFRIDHFVGKETVQNIFALRFGNGMFEPLWNARHIDHVQITVSETVGVEGRGSFYEATGALRDMVPNHLFQLVAMTAMDPPDSLDAEAIRRKKAEVIAAIAPVPLSDAVRGQYGAGKVGRKKVKAYRDSPDVAKTSTTETYAAVKLNIDNDRWRGTPFYLRTGKCMTNRSTEIALCFKDGTLPGFARAAGDEGAKNWLVLQIQPNEGIEISFNAKQPGTQMILTGVTMNFDYKDFFKAPPAVGYETLLYDAMTGDPTLFSRAEQIEAAWAAVENLLKNWGKTAKSIPIYAAGSAGPDEADALLKRDKRQWRPLTGDV